MPIAYVSCIYGSPQSLARGCKFEVDGTYDTPASVGPRGLRAGKKKIKFGSGWTTLAYGEEGELRLKVSKAGKRLLKPGKKRR